MRDPNVQSKTVQTAPPRPLLIVDGDSLAHRAYHGIRSKMRTADGSPTNALVGMSTMLLRLAATHRPRTMLVCWDTLTHATYRHEQLPAYQSGREFDDELVAQLDLMPELVQALCLPIAKEPGYEADDFLAAGARSETEHGGTTLVVTSDRDAFQLVSDQVTVMLPRKGVSELERVTPADVEAKYGVKPGQVPDFIALRGDSSDRIPGATGIGPVKAAAVLAEHGSLEATLAAGRFASEADDLRLFLRIATMQADAPIPALPDAKPDVAGAEAWAVDSGFERLASRLAEERARID